MREITLVLPYFCNLGMLEEQQRILASYPAVLRGSLHVIVVDDASPKGQRPSRKTLTVQGLASIRLFRCEEKIRWNWLFARNLGVHQATTEWVLLTDIDHAMPAPTFERLVYGDLQEDNVYRLSRIDAPRPWPYALSECLVREAKKVHPNTWLLTRAMYDRIGGYDERLSGCYGTDGEFRDRVQIHATAVVLLPDALIRYPREVIPDASTTGYTRKNDPTNDDELRRRRRERESIPNWRPLRLLRPWQQIA